MTTIIDRARERDLIRRLRTDHRFFFQTLWKDRGLDKRIALGSVEYDMIDWAFTGPKRRGVLGPRGIGKTTMLTCPLLVYRGLRDPDRKVIVLSRSASAAKEVIGLTRDWLDSVWFLQHLRPVKHVSSDTTNFYDFGMCNKGASKQPSVKALGNDGMLEGNRANTIIMDDVETKGNTLTQESRDELFRIVGNEAINILYAEMPNSEQQSLDINEIVDIGTYKHEDSFHKRLHVRGFSFRTYPIAYPAEGDEFLGLPEIIAKNIDSGIGKKTTDGNYHLNPMFPHIFNAENIREKMAAGDREFSMEHMCKSNLGDSQSYPLRLTDLIVCEVKRDDAPIRLEWGTSNPCTDIPVLGMTGDRLLMPQSTDLVRSPFQAIKAVVDPAGSGKDMTGLAIVGYLNGFFHLKHCRGHKGGASTGQLAELAELLRQHGARECWVETNADVFDTYAPALEIEVRNLFVKPGADPKMPQGWTCTVRTFRVSGGSGCKEERICDRIAPVLGMHRLIADPSVLKPEFREESHQTFQFQLSRIRRIRKWLREDGAIDALASCIDRFQEATVGIGVNTDRSRPTQVLRELRLRLKELDRQNGKPREWSKFTPQT